MLIGYVRVSKSDDSQTLVLQRDAMLAAGAEPSRIYQDLASSRHDARPDLDACLKMLQPGNTLVQWKLDRLGHGLRAFISTAEDLPVCGVGLKVLTGAGTQIVGQRKQRIKGNFEHPVCCGTDQRRDPPLIWRSAMRFGADLHHTVLKSQSSAGSHAYAGLHTDIISRATTSCGEVFRVQCSGVPGCHGSGERLDVPVAAACDGL
ncbi:MAG: recombinase family protein [Janthinobacterium lividum]